MLTPIGLLLPLIPIEILLSTKGLMFLLLSAYGGAMWTFLSGAPRVYSVIVPNLERARQIYEGILNLPEAELPLEYYYGGEASVMGTGFESTYFPGDIAGGRYGYGRAQTPTMDNPGLWYQLSENVQLHIIPGSTEAGSSQTYDRSVPSRYRHTSFDRDAVKALLKYIVKKDISHSVRSERPLVVWIRDPEGEIVEIAEVS